MNLQVNNSPQKIELIKHSGEHFALLARQVSQTVVGNQSVIESIMISLLCNGHVLLEGVPGVAKTTLIKTIANSLGLSFKRIQFTPDLLPADVIGTLIYNPKIQDFETKQGPIFANIVLADEINRAPAKVQSALLEAMQERQVTIGSQTFKLPEPFFVFATQNPIEQEGTYQLPEAQLDRFMFKLNVGYPSKADEKEILYKHNRQALQAPILEVHEIQQAQELVQSIYTDDKVVEYIIDLIHATRSPEDFKLPNLAPLISMGASPRASIAIYQASKARAFIEGRYFVTPEDVKMVTPAILQHRINLSYAAQADQITTKQIVKQILDTIPTP